VCAGGLHGEGSFKKGVGYQDLDAISLGLWPTISRGHFLFLGWHWNLLRDLPGLLSEASWLASTYHLHRDGSDLFVLYIVVAVQNNPSQFSRASLNMDPNSMRGRCHSSLRYSVSECR
jgi:hypothetical protein